MDLDWDKIRDEYISTASASYRKLSAKYHISYNAIWRRAKAEHWNELKKKTAVEAATLAAANIASQKGENASEVVESAKSLLVAFNATVAALQMGSVIPPRQMKDLADALRSIQMVMDSQPTELDVDEQKARIDKIRKDINRDDDKVTAVTVTLQGELDDYV